MLLLQAYVLHVHKLVKGGIILPVICFSTFLLYVVVQGNFLNISVLNCLTENTVFMQLARLIKSTCCLSQLGGGCGISALLPSFAPVYVFSLFNPMVNFLVAFSKPFR